MCYVEASYYIHCAHLNVHFWTCDDLEHGHLRPKSVMHSFHRLCPACFKDKYVRPDGERADEGESLGPVDDDSEDGLEELPVARRPTTRTPRNRHVSVRPTGTSAPSEPPALAQWFYPPDPDDPRSARRTEYLNALSLSVGLNPTETALMQGNWESESDDLLRAAAVRGIQLRSVVSWYGLLNREVRDGRTTPGPALMRGFQNSEIALGVARQRTLAAPQRLLRARLAEHRRAAAETDSSVERQALAAAAGEILRWRGREEQEAMEEVEAFRRQLSPTRSRSRDALGAVTRDTGPLARSVGSLRDRETAPELSTASGSSTDQRSRAGAEEVLTAGERSAHASEAGEARDGWTPLTRTQHLRDAQESVPPTVGTAHPRAQELEERRDIAEVIREEREDHQLVPEQRIRARVLAGSRQRTPVPLQAEQTEEERQTSLQGPRRFRRRYHLLIDQRGTHQTQQATSPVSTASRDLQEEGEIVEEGAVASIPEHQDGWEEERATAHSENLSERGVDSGGEMVVEESTHSSDHGIAPPQDRDTNDHSGGPSEAPYHALVPRPASRSSSRSLRWTAFETQERPKWSKICSERDCKNGSDHHDDAKSLSTARQFQYGADATLDDLDNDTATYLVTFRGCRHKNVIMLERPAQSSPTKLSAKCGCQIPMSDLRATNLLVNRTAESRQKCLCCNRRSLRLRHFSPSARRIEDSELGTWQDEAN